MQQRRIKGMHMLCSWWICSIFGFYERLSDPLRTRAMITETLMFLMRRCMREASRMKLQFVPEHLYFSSFLGTRLLNFIRS